MVYEVSLVRNIVEIQVVEYFNVGSKIAYALIFNCCCMLYCIGPLVARRIRVGHIYMMNGNSSIHIRV